MRVISRKRLKEAQATHGDLFEPLNAWWNVATHADWRTLADVRRVYRDADTVERYTVFNIKGNKYRLIVRIEYAKHLIFVIAVLTHAQYEKGAWK